MVRLRAHCQGPFQVPVAYGWHDLICEGGTLLAPYAPRVRRPNAPASLGPARAEPPSAAGPGSISQQCSASPQAGSTRCQALCCDAVLRRRIRRRGSRWNHPAGLRGIVAVGVVVVVAHDHVPSGCRARHLRPVDTRLPDGSGAHRPPRLTSMGEAGVGLVEGRPERSARCRRVARIGRPPDVRARGGDETPRRRACERPGARSARALDGVQVRDVAEAYQPVSATASAPRAGGDEFQASTSMSGAASARDGVTGGGARRECLPTISGPACRRCQAVGRWRYVGVARRREAVRAPPRLQYIGGLSQHGQNLAPKAIHISPESRARRQQPCRLDEVGLFRTPDSRSGQRSTSVPAAPAWSVEVDRVAWA